MAPNLRSLIGNVRTPNTLKWSGILEESHRDASGFTLLEMLIAIAVLGGSMAAILASFAWTSDVIQRAKLSQQARAIAQSMLAVASVSTDGLGDSQGNIGDNLSWQMHVIPEASTGPERKSRAATVIIDVHQSHRTVRSYSIAGLVLTTSETHP